jgi:phosphate:Na+ symporter
MKLMGDGLERGAGGGMRKMFTKLSDNPLAVYCLGFGCTAVVQSSSATSVMGMGLASAGLMTVAQAGAFVLGAHFGTTVTGILVSLSTFSVTPILMSTALIGACFILFSKGNRTLNTVGSVLTGFGILFTGMYLMSFAINCNGGVTKFFTKLFLELDNPALLLLIGILFTSIIQSSSAVSGIALVMVTAGTLRVEAGMGIIIGASIGTCVTALLAGIGATADARRVAFFHIFTSVLGAVIVGVPVLILRGYIRTALASFIASPTWQLSVFSMCYGFVASVIMLPFVKPIVKLASRAIKDKQRGGFALYCIDETLLKTPTVGVMQAKNEVTHLAELAHINLDRGLNALLTGDFSQRGTMEKAEEEIDFITKKTSDFLIKLSGVTLGYADENLIGSLHHVIDDVERIGDHAWDFFKQAVKMDREGVSFSEEAKKEIAELKQQVDDLYAAATEAFVKRDAGILKEVAMRETLVDEKKKRLADMHVMRLTAGACTAEAGTYFYTAIASLERIGDHLENVAFSIKSVTGSTR